VRGPVTRVRSLRVRRVPVAGAVVVRCRGRGCRRARWPLTVRRGAARAPRALRRWRLRPGTVLEVRISRPGAVTQRVTFRAQRRGTPKRISRARRAR
jgi:hypothetical protein